MARTKHDKIAERLAKRFKTEYKSDKGIDIVTPDKVIEVEVKENGITQGIKQVEKARKARYIAIPPELKKKVLEATKGTGIGVMGSSGAIIKKATRRTLRE